MLIDLSGGNVVVAGQGQGQVSLVVSKIQVDLGTWIDKWFSTLGGLQGNGAWKRTGTQDEAFTMLRWGHQASIDGHIGVNLDTADPKPKRLQKLLDMLLEPWGLWLTTDIVTTYQAGRGSDNSLSHAYKTTLVRAMKECGWWGEVGRQYQR